MDVIGLPLACRFAEVICSKRQMNPPDLEGVTQALHKTIACILTDNLILITVFCHPIFRLSSYLFLKASKSF